MSDREAIVELLMRYAAGVDRKEVEEVAACFTDDLHIEFEGHPDVVGVDQLRVTFGGQGIKQMRELGAFELLVSTHMIGTQLVAVDGDTATSEAYCIAYLIGRRDGADVALVRGVRYLDELVRTGAGWKIRHRIHAVDWMYDAPASLVTAQRTTVGASA